MRARLKEWLNAVRGVLSLLSHLRVSCWEGSWHRAHLLGCLHRALRPARRLVGIVPGISGAARRQGGHAGTPHFRPTRQVQPHALPHDLPRYFVNTFTRILHEFIQLLTTFHRIAKTFPCPLVHRPFYQTHLQKL